MLIFPAQRESAIEPQYIVRAVGTTTLAEADASFFGLLSRARAPPVCTRYGYTSIVGLINRFLELVLVLMALDRYRTFLCLACVGYFYRCCVHVYFIIFPC